MKRWFSSKLMAKQVDLPIENTSTVIKSAAERLSIKRNGEVKNDELTKALYVAFEMALALESKISAAALDLEGMSGRNYRRFINNLIALIKSPRYLEIGSWAGSTACAALDKNSIKALCIDNWSQFGGPKEKFFSNIKSFSSEKTEFSFIEGDFEEVSYNDIGSYNVYLYDGPHEEKDQYKALSIVSPALDDDFIFIVDDWNWEEVRLGTLAAIKDTGLHVHYSIEVRSTQDNSYPSECQKDSDWHNGYYIARISRRSS